MSASAPLTSTIMTMFGLARLAFVASRKGYQVFSRVFGNCGLAGYRLKLFAVALVITGEARTTISAVSSWLTTGIAPNWTQNCCQSDTHLLKTLRVIGPPVQGVSKWTIGTNP